MTNKKMTIKSGNLKAHAALGFSGIRIKCDAALSSFAGEILRQPGIFILDELVYINTLLPNICTPIINMPSLISPSGSGISISQDISDVGPVMTNEVGSPPDS